MSERMADRGKQDATWTGRLIGAGVLVGLILLFVALNSDKVESISLWRA